MQPYHSIPSSSLYDIPATPDSPSYEKESHMGSELAVRQARDASESVLRDYEEKRDRLAKAVVSSQYLLGDLRNFNGNQWTVRYPSIKADGGEPALPHRPGMSKRTLTFADEPSTPTKVVLNSVPTARRALKRSLTLETASDLGTLAGSEMSSSSSANTLVDGTDDFSILRLDLNMGSSRHSTALISHLEKASISSLLDNRLAASLDHLNLLLKRIHDAHSRVLVTGDLNAGKSTLINALLRKSEVMPTDQQPLTTRFVEVVSAKENDGIEEIHVMDQEGKYDPKDKSTFTTVGIEKLEEMATDMDAEASSPPMRVFLREASTDLANPSILHNGVVDISLIDAPGLNRDSIKTTANFARQEEIDVVVFVVSAANHFTLSAKEFIWQAGHEKAHLFIVVNRFDQIKDKERCRRAVLDQIRQLSPRTYEDSADLVHFVDSAKVALGFTEDDSSADDLDQAFSHLEHSLRSFVLVNRAKSKLGPAQNYITHLLADVELLATANSIVATQEMNEAKAELARVKPVLEKMKKGKEGLEESLVAVEEAATDKSSTRTKKAMERALERISRGELAAPAPGLALPDYPGLIGVWEYAKEIKRILLSSLDFASSLAEDDARTIATEGVQQVSELGDKHLPGDVERSKRIFNASAMFSPRRVTRRASGVTTLGLGLASQSSLADVTISDIFDLQHHIFLARGSLPSSSNPKSTSTDLIPWTAELSGVGIASLAVGAFSFGGKAFSLHRAIESITQFSEFITNPSTRKWAGPILGVLTIGAVAYIIYDLPNSIPRNVGRHLSITLNTSSGQIGSDVENIAWSEYQSLRIRQEVRKVMRLAAWDLRERFRGAVDQRGLVVKNSEQVVKKAEKALEWFESAEKKIAEIREDVGVKF